MAQITRQMLLERGEIHANRRLKTEWRNIPGWGLAQVVLRFDDSCGNGYDTFSLTVDSKARKAGAFGGCMHEQVREVWPELAHLIKWHLTSTDGPMHYIANTVYWAEQGNLENARHSAVAPDASLEQLRDADWLQTRLPSLLGDFRKDMATLPWVDGEGTL